MYCAKLKGSAGGYWHKWIESNSKIIKDKTWCQSPNTLNNLPSRVKLNRQPKLSKLCCMCFNNKTYKELCSERKKRYYERIY